MDTLRETLSFVGDRPYAQAALAVAGAFLIAKIASLLLTGVLARLAKRTKSDLDDRVLAMLHRPVFVTFVLLGLATAFDILAPGRFDADPPALRLVGSRLLGTAAVFVWLGFALSFCRALLEELGKPRDRWRVVEPRTLPLFRNAATVAVFGGAVYVVLLIWNVDTSGWVAAGGVLGVALGFAAKDTVANIFAGVALIADAPYQVGDFVLMDDGLRGQVTHIGIRSTRLLTRDDIEATVPNSVIANSRVVNETGGRWKKERIRITVQAAYGSDIDRVRDVLLSVAAGNESVMDKPEPRVRFREFMDHGLRFQLLCWIDEPVLRGRVTDALNVAVYKGFADAGITIPVPQQDVYIRQLPHAD